MIFVFGSNLAGIHGAGAALFARRYRGAILGVGVGLQGESYAIPTKDGELNTLPLDEIAEHIEDFYNFAEERSDLRFELTPIGCGLAGYTKKQMWQTLRVVGKLPSNVFLSSSWINDV